MGEKEQLIPSAQICVQQAMFAMRELAKGNGKIAVGKMFTARVEVKHLMTFPGGIMPPVMFQIKGVPTSVLSVITVKLLINSNAQLVDTEINKDLRAKNALVCATTGIGVLKAVYQHVKKNAHLMETPCTIARVASNTSAPRGTQYLEMEAILLGEAVNLVHQNILALVESVSASSCGLITFVNIIVHERRCMCVE